MKALETVQQKVKEMNMFVEYSATKVIQDAIDSEQFAKKIRKEIEEQSKHLWKDSKINASICLNDGYFSI
ncbi:hypothetical protein [Parageobacillus toebii]|uniref:hypothetical protein n=1 Tax=Parageobacillus toebii TaxID=153151 RepID=UPI0035B5389B